MERNENNTNKALKSISINHPFNERREYVIVGLTGKIGSGCSLVSSFFEGKENRLDIADESPGVEGFDSDLNRINSVILRFYRYNKPNDVCIIRVRDAITSFLFSDASTAKSRIDKKVLNAALEEFRKRLSDTNPSIADNEHRAIVSSIADEMFNEKSHDILQLLSDFCVNLSKRPVDVTDNERMRMNCFIRYILPILSTCLRDALRSKYTSVFQSFGNELRFFGSLNYNDFEMFNNDLNDCISKKNSIEKIELKSHMFTIAERLNNMIKYLRRPGNDTTPITVIIDSMKNKYESNYLRDRYSAYYLVAVSRDEDGRISHLMHHEKKALSQVEVDVIDYNERPGEVAMYADVFLKYASELISNVDDKSDIDKLQAYIKRIQKFTLPDTLSAIHQTNTDNETRLKELIQRDTHSNRDSVLSCHFNNTGLTQSLCLYFCSIINDPLRLFLYHNRLYQFYLQDVEYCIQNADIFLTNNEPDDGPKTHLRLNAYRYITLMLHPGLVTPTSIERCMQIAFTAKANSGCISRKVGAVVTDSKFNILSLGWNDVPYGQTPCLYRNLIELWRHNDPKAYSTFEWSADSVFHQGIRRCFSFEDMDDVTTILKGLPACFCFKTINEKYVTREKNPMNSRAMHAEEKALLQCDQQRVKGGYLFTTSSPCEMCAKNAKEHEIKGIYYIEPYPGISQSHVCNSGDESNRAKFILFEGAIGKAYEQLYTPIMPYKDELALRDFPDCFIRE